MRGQTRVYNYARRVTSTDSPNSPKKRSVGRSRAVAVIARMGCIDLPKPRMSARWRPRGRGFGRAP